MDHACEMDIDDVRTRFSEVVEYVVREGIPVTVTNHGIAVVDIVPSMARKTARMARGEALEALGELRRRTPGMSREEIVDLVREGRHGRSGR